MSSALAERRRPSSCGRPIPAGRPSSSRCSTSGACTPSAAASGSFDGAYIVGPQGSAIELTIDAASVDTGCAARDRHLRSADFFGAEEHPQVRFTSTRVTGLGSGRVRVTGELEAAGQRVPLAFDASVRLVDGDLEFEATTTVDQSRFGMADGPLRNVRRPTTVRVKTRLVRVPSAFDGGGSGGVGRGSGLAAARETVGSSSRTKGEGNG